MCKHTPKNIQAKADELLNQYINGEIFARKSHKCNYLIIEVTRRYRLLNRGSKWELLTHEEYNKKVLRWK